MSPRSDVAGQVLPLLGKDWTQNGVVHISYLYCTVAIQWNPSVTDTVGDQKFVRYSEVSLTQGLPVYFQ